MYVFKVKSDKLSGTSYIEVVKQYRMAYNKIKNKTKRHPYARSAYFKKEKIFFDFFWHHLSQKNARDRMRRLKYFKCSVDLIEQSKNKPVSIINRNKRSEILHRFAGITKDGELFYAQIKENKKAGKKYFMSCFGEEE